jgi:hypothetical protein
VDLQEDELKSRYVFIDTCIFIKKHFNFGINSLGRFQQYLEEDKIQLLLPDITKLEIENNIKETAQDAHTKINKLFKRENSVKMMAVADGLPYSGHPSIPTSDEIYEIIINKFKEFIDSENVQIISTQSVNIKKVFDSYFKCEPPFGSGSKKHEFPDAFVLEALKDFSAKKKQDLYIISSDSDMSSYSASHKRLIHLKDINDLFDLINKNDKELEEPIRFAENVFNFLENEVLARAKKHFKYAEYMASDISDNIFEDVISSVAVHKVEISANNILSVSDTNAEFEVIFRVSLTVDFSVPDHENAIYDRESGRVYNIHYEKFSEDYVKDFSANITFEYENKIKSHAVIYDFKFEDDIFDVN